MNWGPPVFAHGILQARILEGAAISFSRDRTQVSCIAGRFSCIADRPAERCQLKSLSFLPLSSSSREIFSCLPSVLTLLLSVAGVRKCLVQFSLVAKSCTTLCNPMDCSTPGFPVLHYLPELAQTHVHWVSDDIQPAHPLSSPSPPALNLSQGQSSLQWVSSSYHTAKVLELQLQHQSFQWKFRVDFL